MKFARFMATPLGRGIRIVAGVALIIGGLVALMGSSMALGIVLIAVGAVLTTVGAANVCPPAVLFGGPFDGRKALSNNIS